MTDEEHILEEDLALYAMGSLDESESAVVKARLAASPSARATLAEVLEDLALLGLGAEQLPLPSGARERFQQRIAAEPRAAAGIDAAVAGAAVIAGAIVGGSAVSSSPSVSTSDERDLGTLPFEAPARIAAQRKPLLTAIPWMLAAAMLAAAVYLGSQVSELRSSRDQARSEAVKLAVEAARAQEVLEVLTAPGAQQVTLTEGKPAPAPTGRTMYLPSKGALVFVASHMHPLPASKAYELWIIPANGHAPMAAGTFRPDDRGSASVVLPPLPAGVPAKAFGVTIERAEGSPVPTSPIILSGS